MNKTVKTVLIVGSTIIGLLVFISLVFGLVHGGGYYGGWMMGPGMMSGYAGMGVMSLVWIVFLGLIIWAIVVGARNHVANSDNLDYASDSALNILKRRYARGEVSKKEYEDKMKDLA